MNETSGDSSIPTVHIEFESFISPVDTQSTMSSRYLSPHTTDQLIVYAAPVLQSQLISRCRETGERLKEIKKEKNSVLTATAKQPTKQCQPNDDQQQ